MAKHNSILLLSALCATTFLSCGGDEGGEQTSDIHGVQRQQAIEEFRRRVNDTNSFRGGSISPKVRGVFAMPGKMGRNLLDSPIKTPEVSKVVPTMTTGVQEMWVGPIAVSGSGTTTSPRSFPWALCPPIQGASIRANTRTKGDNNTTRGTITPYLLMSVVVPPLGEVTDGTPMIFPIPFGPIPSKRRGKMATVGDQSTT